MKNQITKRRITKRKVLLRQTEQLTSRRRPKTVKRKAILLKRRSKPLPNRLSNKLPRVVSASEMLICRSKFRKTNAVCITTRVVLRGCLFRKSNFITSRRLRKAAKATTFTNVCAKRLTARVKCTTNAFSRRLPPNSIISIMNWSAISPKAIPTDSARRILARAFSQEKEKRKRGEREKEKSPFLLFSFSPSSFLLDDLKLHKLRGDFAFLFGEIIGDDNLQNVIARRH